jgi:hypothetical protein
VTPDEETRRPRRLSLSDVLTLVLARGSGERDSVALSRNAKGETQIEVVARTRESETLEECEQRARASYDRLRQLYPLSTGYVGAVSDSLSKALSGSESPADV